MRLIRFILNNKIIKSDERDLTIPQIEGAKETLAILHKCNVDDIGIVFEVKDYSNYDVNNDGMFDWRDPYRNVIKGVKLNLKEGSDQHLDGVLNNTLEKHLIFI